LSLRDNFVPKGQILSLVGTKFCPLGTKLCLVGTKFSSLVGTKFCPSSRDKSGIDENNAGAGGHPDGAAGAGAGRATESRSGARGTTAGPRTRTTAAAATSAAGRAAGSTSRWTRCRRSGEPSPPWKRSPHVPLRLDIYYEHDSCYDRQNEILGGGDGQEQNQPHQPQRELLERWCVDYVPSASCSLNSSLSSSPSSTLPFSSRIMTGATASNDKSTSNISQLRQVCKRIIVMLRLLHCMTRMLPAHRLRCLLESHAASDVNGAGMVALHGVGGVVNAVGAVHCAHAIAGGGVDRNIGWGTIGYSILHSCKRVRARACFALPFVREAIAAERSDAVRKFVLLGDVRRDAESESHGGGPR